MFSDKEKQLFRNIKFHAVLLTILSQLTLLLNCYRVMVSSWRHLISLVPKWKTHTNHMMTQHIRKRSREPSTPQVQDWAGTLASPPIMLKHKPAVYFPLPHKWSIMVCSEQPSGNKHIKQGRVHPFVLQMNLLVPTWHKSPPEVIWEHTLVWKNKGAPKILQYSKIPLYPDHPQVQNKCSSEDWQWHWKVSSN